MSNNPFLFGFFVGGLVLWIAAWIYDIYLWRRQQANNAPLVARASSAESQALWLQSDLDSHKTKLAAFEMQVSDLNARLTAAQTSSADFEQKHDSLSAELEKLKQKLAGMVEKKSLDAATAEVSSVKAQLATANQTIDAFKPSAEKASNLEKELTTLKAGFEGSVKKSDLDAANAEITSLKSRILSYSNQTQEFIDAKTRITFLETELGESKAKLTSELETAKTKNATLEAEVNKLKSDGVLLMTERLAPALARIQFLESEQNKPSDASDSADLKAKLAALEVDHSQLHAKVSSYPELEAKIGALEAENLGLHEKISSLEHGDGTVLGLTEQVAKLEAERLVVQTNLSSNAESDAKLAVLRSEKAALMGRISSLENDVATAKAFASGESGFVNRITMLESELSTAKGAANHNTADMAGIKAQLIQANQELAALKAASGSINDSDAEIARLKVEIAELMQAPKAPLDRDRLEKIDGVGDVYEHRLNAAGIWSFQQLSQMSSEAILNLIQPEEWQKIEPEKWILEASERAKAKAAS